MAEGLAAVSIVASIAQLVDLTAKVLARVDEFQSSYGDVPKSLKHINAQLPILSATLEQAKAAIDTKKFNENAALLLPAIQNCTELINELDTYLERLLPRDTDSRAKKVLRSFDSLRQDDKIDRIVDTLRGYVTTLSFYYTAAASSLQPLTDGKLVRIRRWLAAPDPSTNHDNASKLRQTGTGRWFLGGAVYSLWKHNPSWIWLHGIPGCGKTILSSTILEDVLHFTSNDPGKAVAYFYFDFKDQSKQQSVSMVRSLISQLSQQAIRMPASLETLYASCNNGELQPSLDGLLAALKHMLVEHPQTYLVLDALDECTDRAVLISILEQLSQWQASFSGLRVLLTSRNEKDLQDSFVQFIDAGNIVCIESEEVDDDILLYTEKRLETDRSLQKWASDDVTRQDIKVSLRKGAHGMFRWAVCQLDTLGRCRSRKQLRQALLDLPPTLDETYNRILLSIEDSDREYAIRILLWLASAIKPLVVAEVAEVAAYDLRRSPVIDREDILEDPQDILRICSSLVTISASNQSGTRHEDTKEGQSRESMVSLAHYSVKEYLLSGRIRTSAAAMFSLDLATSDNIIAKICLHYLLQFDGPDIILNKNTFDDFALTTYSAQYWTEHAQTSVEHDDTLIKLILTLFNHDNVAYANWRSLIDVCDVELWFGDIDVAEFGVADTLYDAVCSNFAMVTKALLSKYSQEITASEMQNAFYFAVQYADENMVSMLLIASAVNASGSAVSGNPSHIGPKSNHAELQRIKMIDHAFVLAGSRYRENIVKMLLEHGANVNASCVILDQRNLETRTSALEEACGKEGNMNAVKLLLDAGADVNIRSEVHGRHVLQVAIGCGRLDVARTLLRRGARVDASGGTWGNALQEACFRTEYEMVRLLIDHGADVNANGGYFGTALQAACSACHDSHRRSFDLDSSLERQSPCRPCDIVKLLLSKGADINAQGGYFGSALQTACSYRRKESAELLLSEGVEINAQGRPFGTALIAAIKARSVEIVKLLLDKGADIHSKVDVRGTATDALQVAISMGQDEIKQLLLDHDARVEEVQT